MYVRKLSSSRTRDLARPFFSPKKCRLADNGNGTLPEAAALREHYDIAQSRDKIIIRVRGHGVEAGLEATAMRSSADISSITNTL